MLLDHQIHDSDQELNSITNNMGILNNLTAGIGLMFGSQRNDLNMQVTPTEKAILSALKKAGSNKALTYVPKAISNTRKDIKHWKDAVSAAEAEDPKNFALQDLYTRAMDDGLLSSQIENRQTELFGIDWNLKKPNGEIDVEQTKALKNSGVWRAITTAMLDTLYFEYSLIELSYEKNIEGKDVLKMDLIPRTHVVPQIGRFYPDYTEDKFVSYRDIPEYGIWVLEFWSKKRGLVNKAIKHVLMKDFTQSCWAELGEIYGIPPRVLKTDTGDTTQLAVKEKMMADMGAAAWFIIDQHEEMEWAQGVSTNGDVYNGLISLCNNEMSMLVSGAIIAQDTKNGNRSKDESAQKVLMARVLQDSITAQDYWNSVVLPALRKIGFIKGDVTFEYEIPEDLVELWKRVVDTLPYFEIDQEWITNKFRIQITGKREQPAAKLSLAESFFL